MRTFLLVTVAAALLVGVGCKKKQPSEDFTQASNSFAALYGQKLDGAYADPQMDAVLDQLRRVPEDSTDTEAAKALIARIEEGRKKVNAEAMARADAAAKILNVEAVPFNPPSEGSAQQRQESPAPLEAGKDAGTGVPAEPKRGMSAADFDKHFGDCFVPGPTIYLGGAASGPSESRELNDYNRCKDKLPGFVQKYVLFQNGAVLQIMNKSEIQSVTLRPDGGTVDTGP